MGLCYNIAFVFSFEKIYPEKCEIDAIVKVISIKEEKKYYNKYIVKVIQNENIKESKNTNLIIYVDKKIDYYPGDIIKIIGDFEKGDTARNQGGFNYRTYLKQKKIYGIVYCNQTTLLGKQNLILDVEKIRLKLFNRIKKLYDEENSQFLNGILLGKSDEISDDIKLNFRNSGISHVLAISGMHISYIVLGIMFILEKIIKSNKLKNYIIVILLFVFSLLTGFSVSCVRACIMNSMIFISTNLYRKNNFYVSLIFSFIVVIMINPFNIFNVGMWLSYFGTLAIVLFHKFLMKFYQIKIKKLTNKLKKIIRDNYLYEIPKKITKNNFNIIDKKLNKFKNIKLKLLNSFFVSISAQILILPIMVYVFNTISLSFLISNILVCFFIGPVLIIGYISIILSFFSFPIANIISKIESFFIFIIFKISEFCSFLPFSKIYFPTPNILIILIYYILIFFIVYFFNKKRFYMIKLFLSFNYFKKQFSNNWCFFIKKINFKILKNNKKDYLFKSKPYINILYHSILKIIIVSIILSFSIVFIKNIKQLKINFIDVGQGDSSLIITPKGNTILIDGGEGNSDKYDYGENVLLPYLLDRKIMNINYLIISHCDSDHIGGLFAVLKNIKVDNIFIGVQCEKSEQLEDLVKVANSKRIKITTLKSGDIVYLEKNIKIHVLWPDEKNLINENKLNNNSLVFKILYKDFSMLFTGDIEEVAERQMLEKYKNNIYIFKSQVLKVAHHGSKTSSTYEFIKNVNPEIALIGVGKKNTFGHPNKIILERLYNFRYKSL